MANIVFLSITVVFLVLCMGQPPVAYGHQRLRDDSVDSGDDRSSSSSSSGVSSVTHDAVEEHSQPMTDVLKEKWGILFDILDSDDDGIYALDDEFYLGKLLIDYYHASEDRILGLLQYWLLYRDVTEAFYGTTKTAMTRSEYVTAHEWYWLHHFDLMKHRVHEFFNAIFHAADSGNDGFIHFEEFQYSYAIFGDSAAIQKKAKQVFKLIDADKDEIISEDEYVDINVNYIIDPDITAADIPLY